MRQSGDIDAAATERLEKFQRLLAKLDDREMAKLEAFMRALTASPASG